MSTCNLAEALDSVDDFLDNNTPFFMWGPPGVGKSKGIYGRIKNHPLKKRKGWGFIDFRAPLRESVDIRGMPDLDSKAGVTKWLPPDELPNEKRDGKEGLLFLDELNAAPAAVQVACFGLVLDRKVADYTLPPGWRIGAAGNEQKHRAAAQKMPSALANRFAHLTVEPDANTWIEWAYDQSHIPPMLPAFIRFRPNLLYSMEGTDLKAFPTPRSWEEAAKYLDHPNVKRRNRNIEACVGNGPMNELTSFIEAFSQLPSMKDIVSDPEGAIVPETVAGRYAVTGAIARYATRANFKAILKYAHRLGPEMETVTVLDATKRDDSLCSTPEYTKFKVANKNLELA